MPLKVFISSTAKDLRPYRNAVFQALEGTLFTPEGMEKFGARAEEPLEACVKEVAAANLFVGIYAWRYGYVPSGSKVSITEQELLTANALDKPIFCFLVAEDADWPEEHRQREGERQLAELKRRVERDFTVARFTSAENLALQVSTALGRWAASEGALSEERRILIQLWKKVHLYWIQRVLHRSVAQDRRLEIGWDELPVEGGQLAAQGVLAGEGAGPRVLKPIHDFFHERGKRLLILGAQGAGKTMALLELAQGLGRLARASPDDPIPVVFNLGSWKGNPSLTKWMGDELKDYYGASEEQLRDWIEEADEILPLLDGLDEVERNCRDECVEAINDWLSKRGLGVGLAISCSTQVFSELPAFRNVDGIVALQPLAPPQVDAHLAAGGPELAGLGAAVAASSELRELTETPLMLSLLEQTYEGVPAERIEVQNAKDVYEGFIKHALRPESKLPFAVRDKPRSFLGWKLPWCKRRRRQPPEHRWQRRYQLESARPSLVWLARKIPKHRAPLFRIERLQPAWLDSPREIWGYALFSRALGGILIALPLVWIYRSPTPLLLGLMAGALAGGIDALWLQQPVPKKRLMRALRRPIGRGLLISIGVFALLLVAGPFWWWLFPSGFTPGADWRNLRRAGLLFAPLYGLVFGLRGAFRDENHDIRVREQFVFVWKRWSWRLARLAAFWSAICGLLLAIACALDPTLSAYPSALWLIFVPAFFLLGGLVGGAIGGLKRGEHLAGDQDLDPGQGVWRTLGNAGLVALCVWMAATAALVLYQALTANKPLTDFRWRDISWTLKGGFVLAVWSGLWFSGLDFVQHFTLRLILRLRKRIPFQLVRFLNYATGCGILNRPGRSYSFCNSLLREHLAKSDSTPPRPGTSDHPPSPTP